MKRFFIAVFAIFMALSSCRADGRKEVVAFENIPSAARQVVSSSFAGSAVSVVLKETELFEVEYEVRFEDGKEIVFDEDGVWKKIDCHLSAVPEALVPAEILSKVHSSFPKSYIIEIEKDRRGYDVELNNGLDLNFDSRFRMLIDD